MKFTILAILASSTLTLATSICTTTTLSGSPLLADCTAAYNLLPAPRPGGVVACPLIYAPVWKLKEVGTCRIESYSSTGAAACADRQEVLDAAGELLNKCVIGTNVEGVAEFKSSTAGNFGGVRFVKVQV